LVVGLRLIKATNSLTPCIVFGGKFSSWLVCLVGELGFQATAVVLEFLPCFMELIRSLVDSSCSIYIQEVPVKTSAQTGFIDGCITTKYLSLIQDLGLTTVASMRGLRRPLAGWVTKSTKLLHLDVGGVTIKHVGVTVCSLTPKIFSTRVAPDPIVMRDASTIMDSKGHSLFFRPVPTEIHLTPLRCQSLGPRKAPYVHSGRLLPANVSRKTKVLTPTLFAPKGTWVVQLFTGADLFLAHDWPMFLIDAVGDSCKDIPDLLPGKCLVAGMRRLVGNGGILGFGLDLRVVNSQKLKRTLSRSGTSV
jgi:hypothetical protein